MLHYMKHTFHCLTSICMSSCIFTLYSLFFSLLLMSFFILNNSLSCMYPLLLFLLTICPLTQMSVHTDCTWFCSFTPTVLSLKIYFHSLLPSLCFFLQYFCPRFLLLIHLSFLAFAPTFYFCHPPHPPPPSLPTVGKWRVARVPAWTGTPLGAVAHPGPNSLAPVAMWTCSRPLPRQHHLPRSPPSTSIRKMGTTRSLRVHGRDRLSITDR